MAYTSVKIPSSQGGPFTKNSIYRMDFTISNEQLIDCKKSYISLETNIITTNENDSYNCVYEVALGQQGQNEVKYSPRVLIRYARLESSTKGLMEEIQNANVYMETINDLVHNSDELEGQTYFGRGWETDVNSSIVQSAFRRLIKSDSGMPELEETTSNLIVPLSDVLGIFQTDVLYMQSLGTVKLYLELEYLVDVIKYDFGNLLTESCENFTATGAFDSLTLSNTTYTQTNCPYYINQLIRITGDLSGIAFEDHRKITEISQPDENDQITITFSPSLNYGVGAVTSLEIRGIKEPDTANWSVSKSNIVLYRLNVSPQEMNKFKTSSYSYLTTTLEKTNITPNVSQYKKQYILEDTCLGALALQPTNNNSIKSDLSTDLKSYRWSLNNVSITNRDVGLSPLERLHLNVLDTDFKLMGMPLKNLSNIFNSNVLSVYTDKDEDMKGPMMLSFELSSTTGNYVASDGVLYLFKKVRYVK